MCFSPFARVLNKVLKKVINGKYPGYEIAKIKSANILFQENAKLNSFQCFILYGMCLPLDSVTSLANSSPYYCSTAENVLSPIPSLSFIISLSSIYKYTTHTTGM